MQNLWGIKRLSNSSMRLIVKKLFARDKFSLLILRLFGELHILTIYTFIGEFGVLRGIFSGLVYLLKNEPEGRNETPSPTSCQHNAVGGALTV